MSLKAVFLAAILAVGMTAPVLAEEESEPTPAPENLVTVEYGPYTFELDAEQPQVTCILESRSDLDGSYFEAIVWVRDLKGYFIPLGTYESRATGPFANHGAGECLP